MATTQARRTLDWIMAVAILALPAAFLHSNFKARDDLNGIDRTVLAVSSPIQSAVSWVIEKVGGVWNGYVWLVDVEDENDELRKENDRLRRELAEARRSAGDARALEDLVALRDRLPAETIAARVVAASTNSWFRVARITVDRGAGEVKAGMAVLAADGVVGRIQRVYGGYADVLLAVDPESSIEVVDARTGSRGVLKGSGGGNGYTCRIDYLLRTDEVQVGDAIRTSGLGGIFPKDELVGRITKVTRGEVGLYQEVEVEPAVDFARVSSVIIIQSAPPPPDPSAKSKKTPEPAYGLKPTR